MKRTVHEKRPCVSCSVTACKYNTVDRSCCAEEIRVLNEQAESKGETCCGTFCPRGTC